LLIVIAIIGILAAIAIPMYKAQTIKAKMTEVTNGMSNVASAVAGFYQENNYFPAAGDKTTVQNSLGVATAALTRIGTLVVTGGAGTTITAKVSGIDTSVDGRDLILVGNTSAVTNLLPGAGLVAITCRQPISRSDSPGRHMILCA
jgi:type IV pilus assembly protein PilA